MLAIFFFNKLIKLHKKHIKKLHLRNHRFVVQFVNVNMLSKFT